VDYFEAAVLAITLFLAPQNQLLGTNRATNEIYGYRRKTPET
jgi:hypothetical protein